MSAKEFEYDVAFSFTAKDEQIALAINDQISDRLKTFIYSERQKEIAGTDGMESFSAVYGQKARLVVVMYRPEWGQTNWTRVEMHAIKNRSLEDGWDFTVFIPTTPEHPTMPPWLPKTRLYVGLERWGIEGAGAVIESRVSEQGGQPKIETLEDRVARFARAKDLQDQQTKFHSSKEGVHAATKAYEEFSVALENICSSMSQQQQTAVSCSRDRQMRIVSGQDPINLIVDWQPKYGNSLRDASLVATFYLGFPDIIGYLPSFNQAKKLKTIKSTYELIRPDYTAYRVTEGGRTSEYKPDELADFLMRNYMDLAERRNPSR